MTTVVADRQGPSSTSAALPPTWGFGSGWTLFLDRDGVINRRIPGDYVRRWSEFEFLPGSLEALVTLSSAVDLIVVVTNQRGVALGRMSEADVAEVHARMAAAVQQAGGRVDGVFVCPHDVSERCGCRKPAPGLVGQALMRWPSIDPARSVLVGDSTSDMACARNASGPGPQIGRVWIGAETGAPSSIASDAAFPSLADFSHAVSDRTAGVTP
jgi:D-glycero-D-manno-heptose 1,7-bisphosphate phosphatase